MLSVVLINYNHAHYLPKSLGSLLSQTRPPDELIIVDDCSTDDSVAVISRMITGHPYARLLRNASNQGALFTGRRGLAEAQGDYFFFAAADDEYSHRLFDVAVGLLDTHPQAAFFSSGSALMDEEGRPLPSFRLPRPLGGPGYVSPVIAAKVLMRDDSWFMGNTAIYRRSAFEAEGSFPQDVGGFADGYLMRHLALRYGACYSPEELGTWRRVEGSISWGDSVNIERAKTIAATAGAKMTALPEIFPKGYARRWQQRHLFSVYALQLRNRQKNGSVVARLKTSIHMLFLFARMRPWDIGPTIIRYLRRRSPRQKTS